MILSLYDFRIAYTCHASVSQRGRIIVVKADFQIVVHMSRGSYVTCTMSRGSYVTCTMSRVLCHVVHMSRVLNFVADVPLLRY